MISWYIRELKRCPDFLQGFWFFLSLFKGTANFLQPNLSLSCLCAVSLSCLGYPDPCGCMLAVPLTLPCCEGKQTGKLLVVALCRQLSLTATESRHLESAPGVNVWALLLGDALFIPSHPTHSHETAIKNHSVTHPSSLQGFLLSRPNTLLFLWQSWKVGYHGRSCHTCN